MKRRRIVPPEQEDYSADDYTQLLRVREAESLGAFSLLREKLGTLKGCAIETHDAEGLPGVWLTLEGYRKYLFFKSQTARYYFETHGADAKDAFRLKDLRGKPLFDARGMLSQEGDAVYNHIQRGLPTWWRHPDGKVGGTVRPPPELLPVPGKPAPAQAAPPPMEDAEAAKKAQMLKSTGYEEISASEEQHLLKVTKRSEAELEQESSLQVIRGRHVVFYLMAPSDPVFALIARYLPPGADRDRLALFGEHTRRLALLFLRARGAQPPGADDTPRVCAIMAAGFLVDGLYSVGFHNRELFCFFGLVCGAVLAQGYPASVQTVAGTQRAAAWLRASAAVLLAGLLVASVGMPLAGSFQRERAEQALEDG
ncbi:MAG: hypothetical protein WCI75_17670, partial [candidate division NC10 bacterium]